MNLDDGFVSECKALINKCIDESKYSEASELIEKYMSIGATPDADIFYSLATVADSKGQYGVAIYYLNRLLNAFPDDIRAKDYLDAFISGFRNDKDAYLKDISSNRKRLRIIVATGHYKALDLFAHEFAVAFKLLGHSVLEVCATDNAAGYIIEDYTKGGVDLIFSFNNVAATIKSSRGRSIVSEIECVVANFLVDHPLHTIASVKKVYNSPRFHEFVVDRDHVDYLDSYEDINTSNHFLPHGGKALDSPMKPLEERSVDVLYVGSTKAYDLIGEFLHDTCSNLMKTNTKASVSQVVYAAIDELKESGVIGSDVIFTPDMLGSLMSAYLPTLGYYRLKAVEELVNSGVNVHVYGPGWEKVSFTDSEFLHIHEPVDPDECLELMYDSKIVLNSMPWFKDGTHERIFNAMLAGSIAVTDSSKWIRENIIDGEEAIIFELNDMDSMVKRVKDVLNMPQLYQDMAINGYRKAVAYHTWSHRAVELLMILYDELF